MKLGFDLDLYSPSLSVYSIRQPHITAILPGMKFVINFSGLKVNYSSLKIKKISYTGLCKHSQSGILIEKEVIDQSTQQDVTV